MSVTGSPAPTSSGRLARRLTGGALLAGGLIGTTLFGALPSAFANEDPALNPPNCTAGDLEGVRAGVDASTSAYLFTHPDYNFFVTQLASFGLDFANISQQLPFRQVDPSDCFTPTVSGAAVGTHTSGTRPCALFHVNGTYAANSPDANGGYVPVTGPVNGLFGSGTDFVFQTRYDASVTPAAVVPEPGSLALLGMGLAVAGVGFSRRKSTKS